MLPGDFESIVNLTSPAIFKTLDVRAREKGFESLREALSDRESEMDQRVVYIVLKSYDLIELCSALEKLFHSNQADLKNWLDRSWGKTVVLAGNPDRISMEGAEVYASSHLKVSLPILQSSRVAKKLLHLCVPLTTEPVCLDHVKHESSAAIVDIQFSNLPLSLGKWVVQVVHILMDVSWKLKKFVGVPRIDWRMSIDFVDDETCFARIDGGLTELAPFTHVANARICS